MFKRVWDEHPVKTGPQVEFDERSQRYVPVQQVFTAHDQKFLKSVGWSHSTVTVRCDL